MSEKYWFEKKGGLGEKYLLDVALVAQPAFVSDPAFLVVLVFVAGSTFEKIGWLDEKYWPEEKGRLEGIFLFDVKCFFDYN